MPSSSIARSSPRPRVPTTPSMVDVVEQGADVAHVLEQVIALDGVEDGEPGGAREGVAAERRAVLARRQHRRDVGAEGHEGADRHPAAEALGEGHRVGHDARRPGGRTSRRCGRSPVWISSTTSSAPWALVSSRARRR